MKETRVIHTKHAVNLRDLGGLPAARGKRVKKGLVFRSDDLSDVCDSDLEIFNNLGVKTVVDFRDRREAARNPDRLPASVATSVNIPIEPGKLMGGYDYGTLTRDKAMGMMITAYRSIINDYQDAYREFMALLADAGNLPLLFHCTAGKDRTGLAAVYFYSALGVSEEDIAEDYLLSRECLKRKFVPGVDYDEILEPLYSVMPEFLTAAIAAIDSQYGGMETYLTKQLHINIPYFRTLFTE